MPVCSPGFIGVNCLQTCGNNSYGIQCQNTCNCDETEFCHRKCGCLKRLEYSNSSMKNDSSFSENVTLSYIVESCQTSTDAVPTSKSFTYCFIFFTSVGLHLLFFKLHFLIAAWSNATPPNQALCTSYQFIILILNTILYKRPL